jgi:hypothetical protein
LRFWAFRKKGFQKRVKKSRCDVPAAAKKSNYLLTTYYLRHLFFAAFLGRKHHAPSRYSLACPFIYFLLLLFVVFLVSGVLSFEV